MGIGYTLVMVAISLIRELFGAGTIMAGTALKVEIIPETYRIGLFNSAPGGFLVFGIIAAIVQFFKNKKATKLLKEENEKQLAEQKKAEEEIAAKLERIAKAKTEAAAKKAEETSKSELPAVSGIAPKVASKFEFVSPSLLLSAKYASSATTSVI